MSNLLVLPFWNNAISIISVFPSSTEFSIPFLVVESGSPWRKSIRHSLILALLAGWLAGWLALQ
jgi:hypothetical protein